MILFTFLLVFAWADQSVDLTKLEPLPLLHTEMVQLVSANTLSEESLQVLKEYFHSRDTVIVPLDIPLREKLKLDKMWNAVFYPGDVPGIKKAPIKAGEETLNDGIRDDDGGILDRTKLNVLLQDVNGHGGGYKERQGWAVQSMAHEIAHARMHLLLGRIAPKLLKIFPSNLYYRTEDGYFMNGQLMDLLHEWYAYRTGYRLMVEYYASTNPIYAMNRIYRPMFRTPNGGRTYAFNHEQIDSISRRIAIEVYGITSPEILKLSEAGILDTVLAIDEMSCSAAVAN